MGAWRNGKRRRLKISRSDDLVGSIPTAPTNMTVISRAIARLILFITVEFYGYCMITYRCDICDYTSYRLDRIKKHVIVHKKDDANRLKTEKFIQKVYESILEPDTLTSLSKDSLSIYLSKFFQNLGFKINNVAALHVVSFRNINQRSKVISPEDTDIFLSAELSRDKKPAWLSKAFKTNFLKARGEIIDPFSEKLDKVHLDRYITSIVLTMPLHYYKNIYISRMETYFDKQKEVFLVKINFKFILKSFKSFCKKFDEAIELSRNFVNAYDSIFDAADKNSSEYLLQNIMSNISLYDKFDKFKKKSQELSELQKVYNNLAEELCDIEKDIIGQLVEDCIDEYAKRNNLNISDIDPEEIKARLQEVGCQSQNYYDFKNRLKNSIANRKQIIKLEALT